MAPSAIYDAATSRRELRNDPWKRSPLTGQQESDILSAEGAVAVVFGSFLSGLVDVPLFLEAMTVEKDYLTVSMLPLEVANRDNFENALTRFSVDYQKDGIQLLVVREELPWTVDWVVSASHFMAKRPKIKRTTRVVFLGRGKAAWDWSDPAYKNRLPHPVTLLNLNPWSISALEQWISDAGFGPCGEMEIQNLVENTGLWGGLVGEAAHFIRDNPVQWQLELNDKFIDARFADLQEIEERDFPFEVEAIFKVLADYDDGLAASEIAVLLEIDDMDFIKRIMGWGDALSFLKLDRDGLWRLDPIVRRIFKD